MFTPKRSKGLSVIDYSWSETVRRVKSRMSLALRDYLLAGAPEVNRRVEEEPVPRRLRQRGVLAKCATA